ncbi:MAG: hypothetical protein ABF967_11230 [Lacticaseibacillus paracasei]
MEINKQINELLCNKDCEFFDPDKGEKIRATFLKLVKKDYMHQIGLMHIKEDERCLFTWINDPVIIKVLYIKAFDESFHQLLFFAEKKKESTESRPGDSIEIGTVTVPNKDSYRFFHFWDIDTKFKYILEMINMNPKSIIKASLNFTYGCHSVDVLNLVGSRWADQEYVNAQHTTKKS